MFTPKNPEDDDSPITFNGIKVCESSMVQIRFRANPKPTSGRWIMGNIIIPIGGEVSTLSNSCEENNTFVSSEISDGGMEGEYIVSLNFTTQPEMLGKNYTFEVTNALGTTSYLFQLPNQFPPEKNYSNTTVLDNDDGSRMVEIFFKASPKPDRGHWYILNFGVVNFGETVARVISRYLGILL